MTRSVLLAAALGALLTGCTKEVEEIPTGLRGEARSNPLLAAQRTLARLEVPSRIQYGLTSLPGDGEILLTEEGSLAVEGEILDGFLAWVRGGGQAIVCLDGFDLRTGLQALLASEDFDDEFGLLDDASMPWYHRESALLEELDLLRFPVDEPDEDALGFQIEERSADGHVGEGGEFGALVQVDHGDGSVSVMASGHFFNNEHLGSAEHAGLLFKLVDEARRESGIAEPGLLIAYADAPGLWSLLTERAAHALWAALALLVLWLWRAWPRFGPVEDLASEALPGFQSHAASIGRFLWNHDSGPTLLKGIRERTVVRWRSAIPGSDSMTDHDLCDAIAEETGHAAEEVERALFASGPLKPDVFLAVQRTLTTLQKRT